MALIQLSDWARSLGKDPVLARQKALRGTVPAVKVGRDWMIEESIPWDARALSVVKVHVANTFFTMAYAGKEFIGIKNKERDEIEQISDFIAERMKCNVIKVKCDLYNPDDLNRLGDELRRHYEAVNLSYLDEPVMQGVDNQGLIFEGEFLHYNRVVRVFSKDSRSFTDLLRKNNIIYEEIPIVNPYVIRFSYAGKTVYACYSSLFPGRFIYFTDVYPADGDWMRLMVDVRDQNMSGKEPVKMPSKAGVIVKEAYKMMRKYIPAGENEEGSSSKKPLTEKEMSLMKDMIYNMNYSIEDLTKMDHHDVDEAFLDKILNCEYFI